MIYLMHKRGCGGRAFQWARPILPADGDQLVADDVRTVDGKPVFDGDQILCGSCGVWLLPEDLQIEFFDDIQPQENTTWPTNSMLTE